MMNKVTPLAFAKQVKQELSKVVWPTKNETMITTIMVFILGALAGGYFLIVDNVLSLVIGTILGLR